MHHRGPDDEGVYTDDLSGMALGARRLSILDVEGGHQPIANEDGTIVAALNGEIYNFPSLRRRLQDQGHTLATTCDTEVLVHLYEDYGPDLVHALDGMYAFAIWDRRRGRLLLARDRFGEKPLFYTERGGVLAFASELSALTAGTGRGDVSAAAIDAFFVLGYVPGDMCMVDGVRQLPPGHTLTWEDGRAEVRRYWHPPAYSPDATVEDEDASEVLEDLLSRSVRSRMIADVPLGVFLSGGTDSTLVASLAAEHSTAPVKTFTVGYDIGGVSETAPARQAAAALGTDHHELILRTDEVEPTARDLYGRLDQPIADQALLASFAVAGFARRSVKVAVGGEGADEVFGGYPRYRWLSLAGRLDRVVPDPVGHVAERAVRRFGGAGRAQRLSHVVKPATAMERHLDWVTNGRQQARAALYGPALTAGFGAASLDAGPGRDTLDVARRFMIHDQTLWLPDDVLAKADRASMLASLEVRTPFLQPDIAAFAAGVSTRRHLADGGKSLLRAVLRRRLPGRESQRGKVAFRVPAAEWLRGPLLPILREQVAGSDLYRSGYFDARAAQRAVAVHASGTDDMTSVLWPLMVLGFWFDGRSAALPG